MAGSSSESPVTRLTGGEFAQVEGSGTLAVSPESAKANATLPITRITVTYTAATELTDVTLVITVPSDITPSDSSDTFLERIAAKRVTFPVPIPGVLIRQLVIRKLVVMLLHGRV